MAYAALLSVSQLLEQMAQEDHFNKLSTIKQQIKTLHGKFCLLQAFLENDPPKGQEVIHSLERRIREAAYQAEDIIEFHFLNQIIPEQESVKRDRVPFAVKWMKLIPWIQLEGSSNFSSIKFERLYQDFQDVVDEVDSILNEVEMIMASQKIKKLSQYTADAGFARAAPHGKTGVVGFDDDVMEIKEHLCGAPSKLRIIPIVGMGGIGKTALATSVFHDSLIAYHFHIRAWATITQDHKVEDIVLGLLHSAMSENVIGGVEELPELLYKSLKGRKYLIVLDDIWSIEAWNDVKMLFPDDNNGSRIILTTRLADVASDANSFGPFYQMQMLNEEESWNLLREKVFGQECCPPELEETGKLIARNCRGLPLSLVLVAGVVSKLSRTKHEWEIIARDVSLAVAASNEHLSSKILSLSYNHLPYHLRACFLYIGSFPEDYEIPVFKIITLWVAEGFIKPSALGSKSLEDVGRENLEDLVKRNLILVSRKWPNGCVGIHDLVRDLCIRIAHYESFLYVAECVEEGIGSKRRLSFPKPVSWFHPIFENTKTWPVRTIFSLYYNKRIGGFRLLRVLDVLKVVLDHFPGVLLQLFHLKFLAFITNGYSRYCTIPPSLSELQNLQTLIVGSSVRFRTGYDWSATPLPIWKMPQLRHLVFRNISLSPPPSPSVHEHDFPFLENLQTLSKVKDFRFTREAIEMIPNLKKLKVVYTDDLRTLSTKYELSNLVYLHQVEILNLDFDPRCLVPAPVKFGVPLKVKKLTLSGSRLSWNDMTSIGSLPNLEALKLRRSSVVGREWEPLDGEFPRLKFLLMESLDIQHWAAESTHFPRLECLIIRHCSALENIPCGIGEIPTLEVIMVDDSKSRAAESAREILEEQQSMGNDVLQIRVGFHWQ